MVHNLMFPYSMKQTFLDHNLGNTLYIPLHYYRGIPAYLISPISSP